MEKFNRICWDPKNTMNDETIDAQHKKLFEITNTLIDQYENNPEECHAPLQELFDYLSEHFRYEQVAMMKSNYAGYRNHLAEHQDFSNKVLGFVQGCQNRKEKLTEDILSFLSGWIVTHTTGIDLKLGEYLLKSRQTN
jgi:hemerythrin